MKLWTLCIRCCCRGLLGRLLGVKTNAEMDQPVATTFMKSLLAPKARFTAGRASVINANSNRAFGDLFAWRFESRLNLGLQGESVLWRDTV